MAGEAWRKSTAPSSPLQTLGTRRMSLRTKLSNAEGTCLARVRARLSDGSHSMMCVARFVLGSPARARQVSSGELAHACGTSTATVSRFCKTLGYAGYKELCLDLAAAVALN